MSIYLFAEHDLFRKPVPTFRDHALEHYRFTLNQNRALSVCWSMIFSENRFPLFGIMLPAARDRLEILGHAFSGKQWKTRLIPAALLQGRTIRIEGARGPRCRHP